MLSTVSKSLENSRALGNTVKHSVSRMREKGIDPFAMSGVAPMNMGNVLGGLGNRRRYQLYRGHVYSALHALAIEGAGQDVCLGYIKADNGDGPSALKSISKSEYRKTPGHIRNKASHEELRIVQQHPVLDTLMQPNRVQGQWQFAYSHFANLGLTGWSWLVGGTNEAGVMELFSVPTTWVHPLHQNGRAFSGIKIVNPKDPSSLANSEVIPPENFAFSYLPNPEDPMSGFAPAAAQMPAINVDDRIQRSQEAFFDNAITPSAIITVGSNPHPDAKMGSQGRPRLTPVQRQQVVGAIRKVMSGVANYGAPAIVDGLIEKIERWSAKQNEIGWEKSEKTIRARILAAFGVHPFILGEEMPGSYAQALVVQKIFCKRVNTFLNMLSRMVTDFVQRQQGQRLLVWWDECEATDPSIEMKEWAEARKRNDVTQNQFLAHRLGLPPDDDMNQSVMARESMASVTMVAQQVTAGALSPEQGKALLVALGLPTATAEAIAGTGPSADSTDSTEGSLQGEDDDGEQ